MMNIQTVCRICANESDRRIEIFSEDGIANDLANKINLYLPIKVTSTDNLPKQCCWQCTSTILAWHNLVLISAEADKRLRSHHLPHKQFENVPYTPAEVDISRTTADNLDTPSFSKIPHLFSGLNEGTGMYDEVDLKFTFTTSDQYPSFFASENHRLEPDKISNYISVRKDIVIGESAAKDGILTLRNIENGGEDNEGSVCHLCSKIFGSELDKLQHLNDSHRDVNVEEVMKEINSPPMKRPTHRAVKLLINRSQQKINQELLNKAKVVVDDRVFYKCKECGKSLHSMYTYIWHMRIHTGERPYVCDLCGKQFRVSQGLVRHLKETHQRIKNYKCDICGRFFSTKRNMEEHRRIHTNERPYVCDLCGKAFKQKASLFVHNRSHSSNLPFKCMDCSQKFRTKQSLLTHVTKHTGERPFPCELCGRQFRVKYELKRHKLVHSEDKPFSCKICAQTFRQKRIKTTLAPACTDTQILVSSPGKITEKARTSTDSDQDNQYLCNICDEAYDRPVSLKQHQRQEHGLAPVKFRRRKCDIPTNTQFQCPYCEKSYSRKHDMEKHARLHHPEEDVPQLKKDFMNVVPASCKVELASGRMQYNCDFCDKSFQKCYNLTRHRTIHTKVNRHCCHLCGKNFRLNSNLIRHINEYHRNLRRFACPTCPMVFKNKNTRDQHVNTHTNSRPFTCDACGKSFRQGSSLYVHKRVHSDIYPFSCMLCGKTFRRKQNLKEHNLIHSGYKPFKCDQCSMAFRQKHELKRHSKCHNTVVCDRCGTYFGQARSLSVHRRKCEQSLEQLSKATE
ncbi:hypothetical protein GWI33_006725 [Rhynchophorus ferrugineus]|uniref:Uncharacterized protein n=1 Tax=Rhynchophorus ferrugineus TaxID=354439 RepID=A0A834IIB9_RHYFE|nr:hypothetical protein GWI33_006725 [Rhynchophorus ferrugineus]